MDLINRAIAIIKPRQPFLDWLNSLPDPLDDLTLEELRLGSMAILIPDSENQAAAKKYIRTIYAHIFDMELDAWYHDTNLWPSKRDYRTFIDWFDVEIYEMVLDVLEDKIIKEAY